MSVVNNSEKGHFLYLSTFPGMFCSLQPGTPAGSPLNPVQLGGLEHSGQLLWTWVTCRMDACQGRASHLLSFFSFYIYLFMLCIWVFCEQNTEKGIGWATDSHKQPCGFWEPDTGPLEEYPVLVLTTDPSLQCFWIIQCGSREKTLEDAKKNGDKAIYPEQEVLKMIKDHSSRKFWNRKQISPSRHVKYAAWFPQRKSEVIKGELELVICRSGSGFCFGNLITLITLIKSPVSPSFQPNLPVPCLFKKMPA